MTIASIVVPSRGGAQRLAVLLTSAERQTLTDFEVVVVLDGDIDGSEDALRARSTPFPLRIITFSANRGRAAALNAGFHASSGEVLIRADDDLELEPTFVERHTALHGEGEVGVVAMCTDIFPETAYARAYGRAADERIRAAAYAEPEEFRWIWWSGNVSTSATTFHRVGDYDERFRSYGWEDVDWGYRLHRSGVPIVIPPVFTTLHHGPVTSVEERARRALHSGASREVFVGKHGPVLPAGAPGTGAWDRVVAAGAALATERTLGVTGRSLDRAVGWMPPWVAEKQIALVIQAAALAGRRHPERARAQF